METLDCIKTRRSIRKFTGRPVERAVLEKLVDLAAFSPSWKNSQPVRYVAVTDPALKTKIAETCTLGYGGNTAIIEGCPVLLALTIVHGRSGYERDGSPSTSKGDRWEVFDAGIAAQTLSLAAHDLGLGAVILGIFDEALTAEALALPEGQIVAALVALGYPDIAPAAPKRKTAADLLTVV